MPQNESGSGPAQKPGVVVGTALESCARLVAAVNPRSACRPACAPPLLPAWPSSASFPQELVSLALVCRPGSSSALPSSPPPARAADAEPPRFPVLLVWPRSWPASFGDIRRETSLGRKARRGSRSAATPVSSSVLSVRRHL